MLKAFSIKHAPSMICLLYLFKLYSTWLEETKTKSLILYNFRPVYNMLVSLYYGVHFLLTVFLSVTCQYPATLCVSLSVCLSVSLALCVCLSLSLSLCLFVSLSQSLICSSVLGSHSSGVPAESMHAIVLLLGDS